MCPMQPATPGPRPSLFTHNRQLSPTMTLDSETYPHKTSLRTISQACPLVQEKPQEYVVLETSNSWSLDSPACPYA